MSIEFSWKSILAYLLAAFFLVGAIGNTFVSEEIAADYARWGYPDGFHFVTAAFELGVAGLLPFKRTRLWGACLGIWVMLGAAATVIANGEFTHAIAPLVVLAVSVAVLWGAWGGRGR